MQWSHVQKRQADAPPGWCAIVGAPRCGTTSLARYLGGHPGICPASVKEPHFFSRRDLGALSNEDAANVLRDEYVDRFFPDRKAGQVLLDGSVSYLYAPERLKAAIDAWPDARFIIAVRNPLEMLPSLYQRHVCNGDEDQTDFERAWALINDRRKGKRIPRTCVDPRLLDYAEIGSLGKYVGKFFDIVGRERCFVSIFDDLVADPAGQYRRTLDFLGLPHDEPREFRPFRASTGVRSVTLQRLLKRPPVARSLLSSEEALRRDGVAIEKRLGRIPGVPSLKAMRKRLLKWNRTSPPPQELSNEFRSAICTALGPDIDELSRRLDRDLTHWIAVDGSNAVGSNELNCSPNVFATGSSQA